MRSWTAIGQKFDGAHAGICGAIVNGLKAMDREGDFSSRGVYQRAQLLLSVGKGEGWDKVEFVSALGRLAAAVFASMENPREAVIAWEECVEEEIANVLIAEGKGAGRATIRLSGF
jgi:hypothetical protein